MCAGGGTDPDEMQQLVGDGAPEEAAPGVRRGLAGVAGALVNFEAPVRG